MQGSENANRRPVAVSVVVPIYKVERYLRQCIDSLLAQTLQDIEFILVDDGSPDGCPAIVDAYAAADPRVVAVHQANGGYGKAVNVGIARAQGRYIGIIESDDWVEPTMYEKLYARAVATGADIVKCGFYKYDSTLPPGAQDKPWAGRMQNLFAAPDEPFKPVDWPPIFAYHASLWSNLYRADFIKPIHVLETQGAAYQDMPFIMEALSKAQSMSVVKEYLLHYRMEEGQGSSTTRNDKGLMRMLDMTERSRDVLAACGTLDIIKEAFYLQAMTANYPFSTSIQPQWRDEYFTRLHQLMAPLAADSGFRAVYFNKLWKKRLKYCVAGQRRRYFFANMWKQFRHRMFTLKIRKERFIFNLLGLHFQWTRTPKP